VAAVPTPLNGVRNLLSNNEADHARVRRTLSPAFSDKALRDQEALLQQHINLLVFRLGEHAAESKPVDLTRWYNYASFDIICDLAFGEPLYCLRDSTEHMWIRLVTMSIQALALLSVKTKYPIFAYWDALKDIFKDTSARERARRDFFHVVSDKVTRRLAKDTDRPDFFSPILRNQESQARALSRDEMDSNALLFLSAGSETTATALAGTTYLLLSNRDKYARLVREIRSRFSSAGDITLDEVSRLEYMNACIQEGLRYYPPIATGFPRIVPAGGDRISGKYIPEGTAVYVSQHAANHSERNFREPEEYVPERWMGDEEYRDDVRESVNPFSFGPRNCLGKK
jgi:cytochrome P450